MTCRVLIVEDDIAYRESLTDYLNSQGFATSGISSIASYTHWQKSQTCDVMVVDRQLPDGDGLDLVRMVRHTSPVAVVMLTAMGSSANRIQGYDEDVDVYLTKPTSSEEVAAVIRRLSRKSNTPVAELPWRLDAVTWNLCTPEGQEIPLTQREFKLLSLFVHKPGQLVEKPAIAECLDLELNLDDPRRIDLVVRRLRNKVAEINDNFPLKTIYGAGLVFNSELVH